jgi:dissimilatory sulfite reductase (desulfoviridin) alpha/beta subunit
MREDICMGFEGKTHFDVDKSRCIKCGRFINTCSRMVNDRVEIIIRIIFT